jgi:hypothetical protein
MLNKPFLIVIYHSSLVKATINAARVSNLRNRVSQFYTSYLILMCAQVFPILLCPLSSNIHVKKISVYYLSFM